MQSRPRPLSAKQQADLHGERFDRDAEAARRRADAALADAGDDAARIRRLQGELNIRRFEDIPEAKPLLQVQSVLQGHLARISDEEELLAVQRYLAFNASKTGTTVDNMKVRRATLQKKLKADAPDPAPKPPRQLPDSVVAALAIFNDPVQTTPKAQASRLVQLQDMAVTVGVGLRDIRALIEDLRTTAAFEVAKTLQKRHQTLCVGVFRCAQQLAEAFFAAQSVREAFTAAGFRARSDLLPSAVAELPVALMLGSERDYSSQLSSYRRLLQARGLLK